MCKIAEIWWSQENAEFMYRVDRANGAEPDMLTSEDFAMFDRSSMRGRISRFIRLMLRIGLF